MRPPSPAVDWRPDVVVLDLGLPDLDGADVLRMLRGVSAVPVIVATARDDEAEIVRLLDGGADDYVVKPYSAAHLEARIRAVLRRSDGGRRTGELVVGTLVVPAPAGGRRRRAGARPDPLEFDLLAHLARASPEVVTRRELLAEVWQQPYGGGGQDGRRPPVVAPAQAGRDRRRAPLPAHRARGRRAPRRRRGPALTARPVRRRIVLVVVATTTLVVVAFAVPLGALVRSVRTTGPSPPPSGTRPRWPTLADPTTPDSWTPPSTAPAPAPTGAWPCGCRTARWWVTAAGADEDALRLAREQGRAFSLDDGGDLGAVHAGRDRDRDVRGAGADTRTCSTTA